MTEKFLKLDVTVSEMLQNMHIVLMDNYYEIVYKLCDFRWLFSTIENLPHANVLHSIASVHYAVFYQQMWDYMGYNCMTS